MEESVKEPKTGTGVLVFLQMVAEECSPLKRCKIEL